MPRRKAAKNCSICGWLSARASCEEGRFIQVGNSLLLSKQFQALKANTRLLYLDMAMESGGRREVAFTHGIAKNKYGVAHSTYDRAIKELIKEGFIEYANPDNMAQYVPNRFRFSFAWKAPAGEKHAADRK